MNKEKIHIAKEEGIEFVAVHGRTRAQQYTGHANWDYLENLGKKYIIGHQCEGNGKYVALRDVIANSFQSALASLNWKNNKRQTAISTQEEFWALKDVGFEIKRGDRVGIIGRNGAGKSTLLKILSRITEPTTGRVSIKDRVASLLEVGTGFHQELTGRENIYLNGAILGMTKVEIKNLNSFRSVERAIAFEVERQSKALDAGEAVVQETRGWDETKGVTFSQRKKESSHDYRYFPDPDLPSLRLGEISTFRDFEMPELPWQQRERLRNLGFLQEQDIEQLLGDTQLAGFFAEVTGRVESPALKKSAANYLLNDVAGVRKEKPDWLPDIEVFIKALALPSPQAKSSIASGVLVQVVDDSALPTIAQQVIDANPKVVAEFKAGKGAALQFLVGQGMKVSKGRSNPQALREAIQKILA